MENTRSQKLILLKYDLELVWLCYKASKWKILEFHLISAAKLGLLNFKCWENKQFTLCSQKDWKLECLVRCSEFKSSPQLIWCFFFLSKATNAWLCLVFMYHEQFWSCQRISHVARGWAIEKESATTAILLVRSKQGVFCWVTEDPRASECLLLLDRSWQVQLHSSNPMFAKRDSIKSLVHPAWRIAYTEYCRAWSRCQDFPVAHHCRSMDEQLIIAVIHLSYQGTVLAYRR
jgi:hypothetical protein